MDIMDTDMASAERDDQSIPDSHTETSASDVNRKPSDPAFYRYKIGGHRSKKMFEFYDSTSVMGAAIRYAKTGFYTTHKVGTRDEDLYFKVVDTTHPPKNRAAHMPCYLYYESPEQWENHFGTICPEELREKWRNKYNDAIRIRRNA